MKFLKTKTYLFADIASETHGDYVSVVLFVLVGCVLQGKMQLSKGPWRGIVMVHPIMEIAARRACLARVMCPCFAHVVQSTEHHDTVSETSSLHFFCILSLNFLKWGCWIALLFCFVCFSFSWFPGRCCYSLLEHFWIMLSFLCFAH